METQAKDFMALGLTSETSAVLTYALNHARAQKSQETLGDGRAGDFDTHSFLIRSNHPIIPPNSRITLEKPETFRAVATLLHEWAHFVQFVSTPLGIFTLVHRIDQLSSLAKLCMALRERLHETRFFAPVATALRKDAYTKEGRSHLVRFLEIWGRAERQIGVAHGLHLDPLGRPTAGTARESLGGLLPKDADYADTPLTLHHVIEPLAEMYEIGLLAYVSPEYRERIWEAEFAGNSSEVNHVVPKIAHALGISNPCRFMLQDMALLMPMPGSHTEWIPTRDCPIGRLLGCFEAVARGKVAAPNFITPLSYSELYSDLAKVLAWPPLSSVYELAQNAIGEIDVGLSIDEGHPMWHLTANLNEGLRLRRQTPGIFTHLSEDCFQAWNSGWQPVSLFPEGISLHPAISDPNASLRPAVSFAFQAARALTIGESWTCPQRKKCETSFPGGLPFPSAGATGEANCHCRLGVGMAMASFFAPEQITWLD